MDRRLVSALRALTVLGALAFVTLLTPVAAQAAVSVEVLSNGGGVSGMPSNNYPDETLADALAYVESVGGGTVTFAPSLTGQTITLTSGLPQIGYATTITGPSSGTVTISGGGNFEIFGVGSSQSLTISNLTLTGGVGAGTVGHTYGGAISAESGSTLTVQNCVISGNSADDSGGGIESEATVDIQNSTISDNSAGEGGGILAENTTITGSTISGNSATEDGAGIFNSGNLTVSDSTFTGNDANQPNGAGGAILEYLNPGPGTVSIVSSTITGNEAAGVSGIPSGGGGIYMGSTAANEPLTLVDTIVAGNSAPTAPDINSAGTIPQTTASYSLIGNPSDDGTVGSTATDLIGTSTSPLNPLLGPLAAHGGPTQTMLPLTGSPLIDAGKASSGVTTDQRGDARTVKLGLPEPSGGDGTDIGAAELQASEAGAPTVSAVSPATGTAGTSVTITGTNLYTASQVLFGSTPASSITPVSPTQITATVPAGTGTVDVRVVTPAGESAAGSADHFSYPVPTLTFVNTVSTVQVSIDNQKLTLTTPSVTVCQAPSSKLAVAFRTAAIKGSSKAKLKFTSVAFYLDKGVKHTKKVKKHTVTSYTPNATSKKAPVSERLSLKGLKAGSHTLKVVAAYTKKVKHGKRAKVIKTLTSKISVC
jgi:predicted outer membrane repeat protein